MGIQPLEDGLFVNQLILDYLYIEIGGAGYRSVDRGSCSHEFTLVAVAVCWLFYNRFHSCFEKNCFGNDELVVFRLFPMPEFGQAGPSSAKPVISN